MDHCTPPHSPHPDALGNEDYFLPAPDLSIAGIWHIAALHSSCFKVEHNERLHSYDTAAGAGAAVDDVSSSSSDDSISSVDIDDPNATFSPSFIFTEAMYLARVFLSLVSYLDWDVW